MEDADRHGGEIGDRGDNPIRGGREDRLGRTTVARTFAKNVREVNSSEGAVVGVTGPWGAGKSSFVNLMREEFASNPPLTVIDFNPWMFSGTQQLVDHFFHEIAQALREEDKSKFGDIANWLDEYGEQLGSVAGLGGVWGQAVAAALQLGVRTYKKRKGTATATDQRRKIGESLRELEQPVVVVIDDIDRLDTHEIRDIFKLVRLTASFPNLVYILAFDRERVEAALDETNIPGRAYLEKIVQLSFDIPDVPSSMLMSDMLERLTLIVDGLIDEKRFDPTRWPDVLAEILMPLIGNMRDVNRYLLSLRPTLAALGEEIQTVDLIALEAIRIFRPQWFSQVKVLRSALTSTSGTNFGGSGKSKRFQADIDQLIDVAGNEAAVARSLILRVFPAASQYLSNTVYGSEWSSRWRAEHRLAHHEWLAAYLDRVEPAELSAFRKAETFVALLENESDPANFVATVPAEQLTELYRAIGSFDAKLSVRAAAYAVVALADRTIDLTETQISGIFTIRRDNIAGAAIGGILKDLASEDERGDVVIAAFPKIASLSDRMNLLQMLSSESVSADVAVANSVLVDLENSLIRSLSGRVAHPDREWNIGRLFWFARDRGAQIEIDIEDFGTVRAVFESLRGRNRRQSIDSRHVAVEEVLPWEIVEQLFGSEARIREALVVLRSSSDESSSLAELVERYLMGWRPDRN